MSIIFFLFTIHIKNSPSHAGGWLFLFLYLFLLPLMLLLVLLNLARLFMDQKDFEIVGFRFGLFMTMMMWWSLLFQRNDYDDVFKVVSVNQFWFLHSFKYFHNFSDLAIAVSRFLLFLFICRMNRSRCFLVFKHVICSIS